jgi:hypothetical protein
MDKPQEAAVTRAVRRRLSPLRVSIRMLQSELDISGEGRITLDRTLAEDLLTSLELFAEDLEHDAGIVKTAGVNGAGANVAGVGGERRTTIVPEKPVARLN